MNARPSQTTSTILMVRPASFGFNEQTAQSNAFQQRSDELEVQQKAVAEFDAFAALLKDNGVNVILVNDTAEPQKPDAIFPNNWISFHDNGDILLYPMQAENRRLERNEQTIRMLEDRFKVSHIIDLSRFELEHKFLEGTGSMVLDREHKIVYACLSPRTDLQVLNTVCDHLEYRPIAFNAVDANGSAIYHTNVMMCIGGAYAVICLESIADIAERERVTATLKDTGKQIVPITFEQMSHFAGNMLEVKNNEGESLLVMSASAKRSLKAEQLQILESHSRIVAANITTIETIGGGSARCMLAEVTEARVLGFRNSLVKRVIP
jgi:hypothetical protein